MGKLGAFLKKKWEEFQYGSVMIMGDAYTHQLLNDDEWIQNFEISQLWQKTSQEDRDNFYKYIIKEVLKPIVQSTNPLIEIRRAIIKAIRSAVICRLIIEDEHGEIRSDDDRKNLLEFLAIDPSSSGEEIINDHFATRLYMESEAEETILLLVYSECFEALESGYWNAYKLAWHGIAKSVFNQQLGKEDESRLETIDPLLLASLNKVHRDMLDESFDEEAGSPFRL